ncbi:MAG TPA: hypothetical protein PKK74_02295 [Candidatus Methanoculleus thermohydrogenotrophicum]|nr:hypothetical protein [Candidatus Methanoculleus thermohydrogenotrophicum]HOB17514.1 hypothetical protein [Candidatus Methanoculleus thermohydrogenotrophicum]HPZ37669.1 hypothetical protein [Candidatus Methanoculleus thermohydrogenotrophicum]HQC91856.1 hypothetical protein [Candidatus Methanoculleus thermohydrogenotrophicum]
MRIIALVVIGSVYAETGSACIEAAGIPSCGCSRGVLASRS